MIHDAWKVGASRCRLAAVRICGGGFLLAALSLLPGAASAAAAAPQAQQVEMGRRLFEAVRLSADGRTSCASCHRPEQAYSLARAVALGTNARAGTRNPPSLLHLQAGPYFWDGRTARLEEAVMQAFTNPVEMGLADVAALEQRLRGEDFPPPPPPAARRGARDDDGGALRERVALALAAYLRQLPRPSSAYDRYRAAVAAGRVSSALTAAQQRGLSLFRGAAGCAECHVLDAASTAVTQPDDGAGSAVDRGTEAGGDFTDHAFHATLINPQLAAVLPQAAVAWAREPLSATAAGARIEAEPAVSELGRYVVSLDPRDIGAFRTPSLRNVARTAPYMHDGSVADLRAAVDREIYYRALQSNRPPALTERDRDDLVRFLESLSDAPPLALRQAGGGFSRGVAVAPALRAAAR